MLDFLKNIGPTEILVLALIVLLFFGSKIAIRLGRASGETLKEVKKIRTELTGESNKKAAAK